MDSCTSREVCRVCFLTIYIAEPDFLFQSHAIIIKNNDAISSNLNCAQYHHRIIIKMHAVDVLHTKCCCFADSKLGAQSLHVWIQPRGCTDVTKSIPRADSVLQTKVLYPFGAVSSLPRT